MKRLFTLSLLLALPLGLVLGPMNARAALSDATDQLQDVGNAAYDTTGEPEDATTIVGDIINVVLGLLGVIFLILLIYAGILWMTAAGNSDQVDKARNILVTSIIGLVITLAAFSISNFVVDSLLTATGNA